MHKRNHMFFWHIEKLSKITSSKLTAKPILKYPGIRSSASQVYGFKLRKIVTLPPTIATKGLSIAQGDAFDPSTPQPVYILPAVICIKM